MSLGQAMFIEKFPAFFLDGEVESPKIALVLVVGIRLHRVVDDAQLYPMRMRGLHADEVEQLEPDGLEHSLLAAMTIIALLNARAQIQFAPLGFVGFAVVVARLEIVAGIES